MKTDKWEYADTYEVYGVASILIKDYGMEYGARIAENIAAMQGDHCAEYRQAAAEIREAIRLREKGYAIYLY